MGENISMNIGQRLLELRESKKFSQGDIEKRTGLLRCYVSRVENGHTVPAVETLEKWARALEMPLYAVMYDGNQPPAETKVDENEPRGREARYLRKLRQQLALMDEEERGFLMSFAEQLSRRKKRQS